MSVVSRWEKADRNTPSNNFPPRRELSAALRVQPANEPLTLTPMPSPTFWHNLSLADSWPLLSHEQVLEMLRCV